MTAPKETKETNGNYASIGLMKNVQLTEAKQLEFRAEFYNIFNHAQFGSPEGDVINSSFGFVTSARDPRIGQLAIKFFF